MITYNQYHQLRVRQRPLAVTCLSWRDFLRKQDLLHYADAGSLSFWCHYRHLGPPLIYWLRPCVWFCCFTTLCSSSLSPSLLPHLCFICIFILVSFSFIISMSSFSLPLFFFFLIPIWFCFHILSEKQNNLKRKFRSHFSIEFSYF